jgi:hypothetical protein
LGSLALICGCSDGLIDVHGVVTYDGEPLPKATVSFVREGGAAGRPAGGFTDQQGRFELTSYRPDDGIIAGRYRVTVSKVADGKDFQANSPAMEQQLQKAYSQSRPTSPYFPNVKSVLPWVYGDVNETPFSCEVPLAGDLKLEIDSSRSGPVRKR